MGKTDKPLAAFSNEEREKVWDEAYAKEEGVILEIDPHAGTGKVRSLSDGSVYAIDGREQVRTERKLRQGDKVLFAPLGDPEGNDYARIIKIVPAVA